MIRWIVQSQFVHALQRLYPLVITLIYGLDIALDIHQSNTYYRIFQNDSLLSNGTENNLINGKNITENAFDPSGYFYGSIAVWLSVPFLWSLLLLIFTLRPIPVINRILRFYIDYEYKLTHGTEIKILLGILALPIDTIFSVLWIYIIVPYVSFKRALQCSILGRKFDKDDSVNFDLPVVGMRALPQLILGAVFIYNEYPFLSSFDEYFGIPVPMSIFSVAFSGASLFIGIVTGVLKVSIFLHTNFNQLSFNEQISKSNSK